MRRARNRFALAKSVQSMKMDFHRFNDPLDPMSSMIHAPFNVAKHHRAEGGSARQKKAMKLKGIKDRSNHEKHVPKDYLGIQKMPSGKANVLKHPFESGISVPHTTVVERKEDEIGNGLKRLPHDLEDFFEMGPAKCWYCHRTLEDACMCHKESPNWDPRFGDMHFWWNVVGVTMAGKTTFVEKLISTFLVDMPPDFDWASLYADLDDSDEVAMDRIIKYRDPAQFYVRRILVSPIYGNQKEGSTFPEGMFDTVVKSKSELDSLLKDLEQRGSTNPNTLIVLDDCLGIMVPSFFDEFNRFSTFFRHVNASVINICHYYKQVAPFARKQCHSWSFFKPDSEKEFKDISIELGAYKQLAPLVDWEIPHQVITLRKFPGPVWMGFQGSNFEYLGKWKLKLK